MAKGPTSENALHELALTYLDRFAPTVAGMRRYLEKKTRLSVEAGTSEADAHRWVEQVLSRLCRVGLLDDERWARSRTGALRRRGKSGRAIQHDLRIKGVSAELIELMMTEDREDPASELRSAAALARKRRLGPYARPGERADKRQKHLASLARSGFSFQVAREVIDAEDIEDLEARIEARE